MKIEHYKLKDIYANRPKITKRVYSLTNPPRIGSGMRLYMDAMGDGDIFLAMIDEKIVGWCCIPKSPVHGWKYKEIWSFVHRDYRGQGIATKLIKEALQTVSTKKLRAFPFNRRGANLYQKFDRIITM